MNDYDVILISKGDGSYYMTSSYSPHDDSPYITAIIRAEIHFSGSGAYDINIIQPTLKTGIPRERIYGCSFEVRNKFIQLLEQSDNLTEEQLKYTINGRII